MKRLLSLLTLSFLILLITGLFTALSAEDFEAESPLSPPTETEVPSKPRPEKQVIGWAERVLIVPENLELEAKIAPAIGTSSLHAENIKEYLKNGKEFVSFEIEDRNGEAKTIKRLLKGKKSTVTTKGKHKRRVIAIGVCVSDIYFEAEVLLSDRSGLDQELRLGRDVLAGHFVIDPASTHKSQPKCKR